MKSRRLMTLMMLLTSFCYSTATWAEEAKQALKPQAKRAPAGVIELDQTVISGNQELPKVLYIVPWQQPDGLPEIELEPEFTELEVFRRLYPPAYRRELKYYELLNSASQEQRK